MNRPAAQTIRRYIRTKDQSNRRKKFMSFNQTANLGASTSKKRGRNG